MHTLKLLTVAILLILFALASCASPQFTKIEVKMPNDFKMTADEIKDKIPLKAGLYLTSTVRNCFYKGPTASVVAHTSFALGDVLCVGSERMLRNIFKDVAVVDRMDGDLSSQKIDVIVTPELVELAPKIKKTEQNEKHSWDYQPFVLQLTIKWHVVGLNGKDIYFSTITGESTPKKSWAFLASNIEARERENMIELINDHLMKAQNDLYSNAWWKKQWWKEASR